MYQIQSRIKYKYIPTVHWQSLTWLKPCAAILRSSRFYYSIQLTSCWQRLPAGSGRDSAGLLGDSAAGTLPSGLGETKAVTVYVSAIIYEGCIKISWLLHCLGITCAIKLYHMLTIYKLPVHYKLNYNTDYIFCNMMLYIIFHAKLHGLAIYCMHLHMPRTAARAHNKP
jgi:hypothetical protein